MKVRSEKKEGSCAVFFFFFVCVASSNYVFVVANSIVVRHPFFTVNIIKLCSRKEENIGKVLKNRRRGNTSKHRMMYVGFVVH